MHGLRETTSKEDTHMRKIGELNTAKVHFVIYHNEKTNKNPYKIYKKWYDNGWHRSLLESYQDLYSCVLYIKDYLNRNYQ